jgi:hypothetical protein
MSGTEQTADSTMSSSADRMVGMDHAEVRYFTRYGLRFPLQIYVHR